MPEHFGSLVGFAQLIGPPSPMMKADEGPVEYLQIALQNDESLACVKQGLFLVAGEPPLAILLKRSDAPWGGGVTLELMTGPLGTHAAVAGCGRAGRDLEARPRAEGATALRREAGRMGFLAWLFLLNIVLIVDCAINRREPYWYWVLVCLGPLGALAYLVANYESITFPFPLARTIRSLSSRSGQRRCPRCLRLVERLHPVDQGRQVHLTCKECRDELLVR